MDFVTDLPPSEGNTCILETAELLFNNVFRYYGIPEDIVSDRGPQFIYRVRNAFFTLLGVTVSLLSGYHPQSNGQTERKIQEVGRFLRTFCHGHQDSWNQFLGWAENCPEFHASAFYWSYSLPVHAWIPASTVPLVRGPSDGPAVDYWFRESERVGDAAHHHLQWAVRRQKTAADLRQAETPTYQPGQKVWLSTRDIRLHLPCRKLSRRFVGPFSILEQVNPVTYKLQLPSKYKIHPMFHVSLLKPHHDPVSLPTDRGTPSSLDPR